MLRKNLSSILMGACATAACLAAVAWLRSGESAPVPAPSTPRQVARVAEKPPREPVKVTTAGGAEKLVRDPRPMPPKPSDPGRRLDHREKPVVKAKFTKAA